MIGYGQFCPVAKAAELLGERWTLLIVRELLVGARRYAELQRALAKASPTILATRLKELEQAGLVRRAQIDGKHHVEYSLTRAGAALGPLVEQMGLWAARWAPSRLARDDLDAYFLMLDISRRLDSTRLPRPDVTLGFRFRGGVGSAQWWLVVRGDTRDICDKDPGYAVDLLFTSPLRTFTEVWLGQRPFAVAVESGRIGLSGDVTLERTAGEWLGFSAFARAGSLRPR